MSFRLARSSTFCWCLLIALLLTGVATGLFLSLRAPKPPPFMILHHPLRWPVPLRDRLARWIPVTPAWAWAWHVEEAVFGKRKPLTLYAQVVSLADPFRGTLSSLSLGPPSVSDTNGLQVWLLGAGRVKALHKRFNTTPGVALLSRPGISTADGMRCRLFQGNSIPFAGSTNQVGLTFECLPRVRPGFTNLMACVTLSELETNLAAAHAGSPPLTLISLQTNLDAALRVQVPKGSGVFLFDPSSRGPAHEHLGVLIDLL